MSEKTTDMGPRIGHPSICLIKRLLAEKTDSFVNFINNFLKIDFLLDFLILCWCIYDSGLKPKFLSKNLCIQFIGPRKSN